MRKYSPFKSVLYLIYKHIHCCTYTCCNLSLFFTELFRVYGWDVTSTCHMQPQTVSWMHSVFNVCFGTLHCLKNKSQDWFRFSSRIQVHFALYVYKPSGACCWEASSARLLHTCFQGTWVKYLCIHSFYTFSNQHTLLCITLSSVLSF